MSTDGTQYEREVRAARNQSLFRAVNERIRELNVTLASITDTFDITCECADTDCVEVLSLRPLNYRTVRGNPRQFVVLPDHVYPDVEGVVREGDGYVVVEKVRAGGSAADGAAKQLTALSPEELRGSEPEQ